MTMTQTDAAHLAHVAVGIRRELGLSHWDHRGVVAQIRKVADRPYPDVAMAVTRAAARPDARTPGVIPKLDGEHWCERVTDPDRPRPIPRDDWCRDCGRHRLNAIHDSPPKERLHEMGHHSFVHVDEPRSQAQLDAAVRAELAETLRYAGCVPDPEQADSPADDSTIEETP